MQENTIFNVSFLCPYVCVFTHAARRCLHLGLCTLACLGMVKVQRTVYRMLISNTDGLEFQKQQYYLAALGYFGVQGCQGRVLGSVASDQQSLHIKGFQMIARDRMIYNA